MRRNFLQHVTAYAVMDSGCQYTSLGTVGWKIHSTSMNADYHVRGTASHMNQCMHDQTVAYTKVQSVENGPLILKVCSSLSYPTNYPHSEKETLFSQAHIREAGHRIDPEPQSKGGVNVSG